MKTARAFRHASQVGIVVAVVWLLATPSGHGLEAFAATGGSAGAGLDWKKFAGQSIRVFVPDVGQAKYVKPKVSEFEQLTGIKVTYETADVTSYRRMLPVQMTAQSSDYDVTASFNEVDGLQFSSNGWYEPMEKYIQDPNLTSPGWDFSDFPPGVQQAMKVGGKLVSINWEAQTDLLYYRKDLFEQKGLKAPQTFDEWASAAKALNNTSQNLYGVGLRGAGYQMTTPFSAFLYAYGGSWLGKNGKPAINSKEAVNALEMYGKLGHQYGPPGIVSFDWQVPAQQFAQGNVATFLDINLFVPTLESPEKSKVAGKVGFAMVPGGPAGRGPFLAGWAYSISPFSKHKEAAWYFIQWATSKDMNLAAKLDGWPSPRTSAWESPKFKETDKTPEFTQVVLRSYKEAVAQMNPPLSPGVQAREIVGVVGTLALQGGSREQLQKAADEANDKLQKLQDAMKK
jgi:multiple sugar transport system substrate-binding protein